jgi:hypothetical protein
MICSVNQIRNVVNGLPPNDLIAGSEQEIKNADNSNIRLFTVSRSVSNVQEFNC